jgi:hypothetical protein
MSGCEMFPAVAASSVTRANTPSVYGLVASARCWERANLLVAIICIVLVMRLMFATALMRFLISRVLAIGREV